MEFRYEFMELARLGPGPNDDKEVKILNRIIRWTASGVEYEADPRQIEKVVADAKRLFKEFGFSVENVVAQVKKAL